MVICTKCLRAIRLKGGGTLINDYTRIMARGGVGGRGLAQVGGIGGKGGDVYLVSRKGVTIGDMKRRNPTGVYTADRANDASKLHIVGEDAQDLHIRVPLGITVSTDNLTPMGDLNKDGEKLLVARGGVGGGYRSADCAPEPPEKCWIRLDLKLIADCGLVGFPNAGKSTLLKAISRADPKIGQYPFTTLRPQIGMIMYDDLRKISMADLPGLIEGAYRNVGLGHRFLKHVERTTTLLLLVDIGGFKLNNESPQRSALETIALLNRELELYDRTLLRKPAILCLNKIDVTNGAAKAAAIIEQLQSDSAWNSLPSELRPEQRLHFEETLCISAKNRINVDALKESLRSNLDRLDDLKRSTVLPKLRGIEGSISNGRLPVL